jgi:hypothetical protein
LIGHASDSVFQVAATDAVRRGEIVPNDLIAIRKDRGCQSFKVRRGIMFQVKDFLQEFPWLIKQKGVAVENVKDFLGSPQ